MAESTSLVAVHQELLVVQHQLTEQLDLLALIVWRHGQPLDRLRLDAVNLGLDLRNLRERLRREYCTDLLRARLHRRPAWRRPWPPQSTKASAVRSLLSSESRR